MVFLKDQFHAGFATFVDRDLHGAGGPALLNLTPLFVALVGAFVALNFVATNAGCSIFLGSSRMPWSTATWWFEFVATLRALRSGWQELRAYSRGELLSGSEDCLAACHAVRVKVSVAGLSRVSLDLRKYVSRSRA